MKNSKFKIQNAARAALGLAFFIFNFSFLILNCPAAAIPGTVILNKVTLGDDSITNKSIGDTVEMKGTPKQVANTAARDLIPAARRTEGMECWVIDVATAYRLIGGILNANWTAVTNGTTDASSLTTGTVPDGRLPATNRNYTSIFEMVADSFAPKGTVAYVESYYGTNSYGGGIFKKDTTSTAATNYGTVFAATGGGRWRRSTDGTNMLRAEWFGIYPANAYVPSLDTNDQRAMLQNAVDTLPKRGARLILPAFPVGISRLDFTNFFGLTVEGDTKNQDGSYDSSMTWPTAQPILFKVGASNNLFVTVYSCAATTFRGIGFEANNPHAPDEMANVIVDVDQPPVYIITTTATSFINCFFRGSPARTNAFWRGIRFAYTSWQNVEFNIIKGCYFQAGWGNYWFDQPVNQGYAIEVGGGGGGGNCFGNRIIDGGFAGVSRAVTGIGQWYIDGFNGTGSQIAFDLNAVGDCEIRNCRIEGQRQFLKSPNGKMHLVNNAPAAVDLVGHPTGVAMIDAVNLTILDGGGNMWNEPTNWAITNSFTDTGILNLMGAGLTSPQLVAWDRFGSSYTANGGFGTYPYAGWIQRLPLSTWSTALQTNKPVLQYSDSATPLLTFNPSFGRVMIGTDVGGTFGVYHTNEVSVRFGDSKYNPRWDFVPNGSVTETRIYSGESTLLQLQSTNSRLDIVSGNYAGVNAIQYRTGPLRIIDPNDNQVATFSTAGNVGFPHTGTFTVTGPATFANSVTVVDEVYDATAWDDNFTVPTKNAVRDQIQTMVVGGSATNAIHTIQTNGTSLTTAATNLNFIEGANITLTGTNLGGQVGIVIASTGGGGLDPRIASSSGTMTAGSNTFAATTIVGTKLFADELNATNSSSLVMTAAGQTLNLGSGALTLSGSAGGFIGVGSGLTGITLDQLSDVTITSAAAGHTIGFNGTVWTNGPGGVGGGGAADGSPGVLTNQFTTNAVGSAIVGPVRFASTIELTNGAPGVGITNTSSGNTTNSGHIKAATLSTTGATVLGSTVTVGNGLTLLGSSHLTLNASATVIWPGQLFMESPSSGVIQLRNSSAGGTKSLVFGPLSSVGISINTTNPLGFEFKSGDGGYYTNIFAKGITAVGGAITNNGIVWFVGAGSPETVQAAPIGSLWSRTDGSTDTAVYRKETGTGNTGWIAIAAGAGGSATNVTWGAITGTLSAQTDLQTALDAKIASNAGLGTNNTFTGATNYGNNFRTNWTWMDSLGWHNTNNSAANQGVVISRGNQTNDNHIKAATMSTTGILNVGGTITAGSAGAAGTFSGSEISRTVDNSTITVYGGSGGSSYINISGGTAATPNLFRFGTAGADRMRIDAAGQVEISKSIVATNGFLVPTNGMGNAVVDFNKPDVSTNCAAAITFTGITNFKQGVANQAIIHLLATGTHTITFPTEWKDAFAGGTTYTTTNGVQTDLLITCQVGLYTNITKLDYY